MPVIFSECPADARLAGLDAVEDLAGLVNIQDHGSAPEEFSVPVYAMGLTQCATREGCLAALTGESAGWKLLVSGGRVGVPHMCDLVAPPGAAGAEATAVYQGRFAALAMEAVRMIGALPEAQAANYELRWLSIPALSVEALWLHSQQDSEDVVKPVFTSDEEFLSRPFYGMEGFIAALLPLAERRLAVDDEPICG